MESSSLVTLEAVHRALAGRAVPAHVGGPLQPTLGLLVEIRVVGEPPTIAGVHATTRAGGALPRQLYHHSHLSLFATRYSVHPMAAGKTVEVRLESEQEGSPLHGYLGGELVAAHRVAAAGTPSVTLAEHAQSDP